MLLSRRISSCGVSKERWKACCWPFHGFHGSSISTAKGLDSFPSHPCFRDAEIGHGAPEQRTLTKPVCSGTNLARWIEPSLPNSLGRAT